MSDLDERLAGIELRLERAGLEVRGRRGTLRLALEEAVQIGRDEKAAYAEQNERRLRSFARVVAMCEGQTDGFGDENAGEHELSAIRDIFLKRREAGDDAYTALCAALDAGMGNEICGVCPACDRPRAEGACGEDCEIYTDPAAYAAHVGDEPNPPLAHVRVYVILSDEGILQDGPSTLHHGEALAIYERPRKTEIPDERCVEATLVYPTNTVHAVSVDRPAPMPKCDKCGAAYHDYGNPCTGTIQFVNSGRKT